MNKLGCCFDITKEEQEEEEEEEEKKEKGKSIQQGSKFPAFWFGSE